MKQNYTYVAEVLDRSGSMASIATATRDGHNEFIRAQKLLPGECSYLLAQFDNEYDILYDGPMAGAPELTVANYVPRGSTALLDAIGRTVTDLGVRLGTMEEDERPDRVVVVIITDGQENASRAFRRDEVFALITKQREVYQWQFLFLGANQDAIAEAMQYGISANNAANYATFNVGGTYRLTSNKVAAVRTATNSAAVSSVMAWTEEERKQMEGEK